MGTEELETLRADAIARLDASAAQYRERLAAGDTHALQWESVTGGVRARVGRGHLYVWSKQVGTYPGVNYTSSYGANNEKSYSEFIPGVTFDEALLLVYAAHRKQIGE